MLKTIRAAAVHGIAAMFLLAVPVAADDFAEDRAAVDRLVSEIEAIAKAQPDLKPALENRQSAWAAYSYRDDGYDLTSVGFNWSGSLGNGENPGDWMAGVILEAEGSHTEDFMAGGYAGVKVGDLYADARALGGEDRWLTQGNLEYALFALGPVAITPFAAATWAGIEDVHVITGEGGVEASTGWGPVTLSTSAAVAVDDALNVSVPLGVGADVEWSNLGVGIEGSYDPVDGDIGGAVTGRMAF